MDKRYMFHNIILFLWESSEDIEKFVDKSRKDGLNIRLEIGVEEEISIEELADGMNNRDILLITDEPQLAYEAYSAGIAVLGYQPPNTEGVYLQAVRYVAENLSEMDEEFLNMVYQRAHDLPITILQTARTMVREMTVKDLPALYSLYEEAGVKEWVEPLYPMEEEISFTTAYIENMYGFYGYGLWLVFDRESGELIGRAGLSNRIINEENCVELGYIISGKRQREGIGYEVALAIAEYAEGALGIEELYICVEEKNTASKALAEKLGFEIFGQSEDEKYFIYRRKPYKK